MLTEKEEGGEGRREGGVGCLRLVLLVLVVVMLVVVLLLLLLQQRSPERVGWVKKTTETNEKNDDLL